MYKTAYPALENPRGTYPMSQKVPIEPIKHRLQNKNRSCRKKDKIRKMTVLRDFVLHFRTSVITKREKTSFQKKSDVITGFNC